MRKLVFLPPAARFIKKLKDKTLKTLFQNKVDEILSDPTCGDAKGGDLSGVYCCDIFHNKINYELAYTLVEEEGETVVVIMAGTRENFYEEIKRYFK